MLLVAFFLLLKFSQNDFLKIIWWNSLKFCFLSITLRELAAAAKSLQSCPTLCDPTDDSPPGSSVPGILQARILEWVAILGNLVPDIMRKFLLCNLKYRAMTKNFSFPLFRRKIIGIKKQDWIKLWLNYESSHLILDWTAVKLK